MANSVDARTWVNRGAFVVLATTIMIVQLVPQSMAPTILQIPFPVGIGGPWEVKVIFPDIMLAVTVVWVARRPKYLPVWIVALIFLICDLVFQRPPGLWAGFVVLLTESLRKRSREFRSLPFLAEWGTVALGVIVITLANRFVLAAVVTPLAPLGLTLVQMILTITVYPLVVLVAHYLFGVSKAAPGEIGSRGQPI